MIRAVFTPNNPDSAREARILTIAARTVTAIEFFAECERAGKTIDLNRFFEMLSDGVLETYPKRSLAWDDFFTFADQHSLRLPEPLATEVLQ